MQNGMATWEDSWVVSYKTKHMFTIWLRSLTPQYLLKGAENMCPHEYLHMDVTSSLFITTAGTWNQPRCSSVGEWINRLVQPDSGISFGTEKPSASSHENTWRNLEHTWVRGRSCILPGSKLHDILGKAKPRTQWKDEWSRGFVFMRGAGGRWVRRAQRIFRAANILCILYWWIHVKTLIFTYLSELPFSVGLSSKFSIKYQKLN